MPSETFISDPQIVLQQILWPHVPQGLSGFHYIVLTHWRTV